MSERTIVVECSGGCVVNVHGLPDNFVYEVADWDEVESGEVEADTLNKMISNAYKK